jgi:aspartyl-tRNA(Asn)/glutamyl-tRNA(Gln) amidotransferase subunit A
MDYVKASRLRTVIQREWQTLFERFDIVVTAGRGEPPLRADKRIPDDDYAATHVRLITDGNLAGLPAITIPMGFTKDRWPITFYATASPYEDHLLIDFASAYQSRTAFHRQRP